MANQSVRLTNSAVVSALNNKADIELENSTRANAIESLANSAASAAQSAATVAHAANELIETQMPLKVNKSGDTFNGNVIIDGNLTVTGDVNIPADGISGSVEVATSATKDSNGNVIVDTYLNKFTSNTLTNPIYFPNGTIGKISPAATDQNLKELLITGDTTSLDNGAFLSLRSSLDPVQPSAFILGSLDLDKNQHTLVGEWKSDIGEARLHFDQQLIQTVKYWDLLADTKHMYFNSGLALVWGNIWIPEGLRDIMITFPYPMIHNNYSVFVTADTILADVNTTHAERGLASVKLCKAHSSELRYDFNLYVSYIVVGSWK